MPFQKVNRELFSDDDHNLCFAPRKKKMYADRGNISAVKLTLFNTDVSVVGEEVRDMEQQSGWGRKYEDSLPESVDDNATDIVYVPGWGGLCEEPQLTVTDDTTSADNSDVVYVGTLPATSVDNSDVVYAPAGVSHKPVNYSHDESSVFKTSTPEQSLDQFGVYLGRLNMTYIASPSVSTEAPEGFDSTPNEANNVTTKGDDEVDGRICSKALKLIKTAIVAILQYIIDDKVKGLCLGCDIDHPSQTRHTCLYEPDRYFFEYHYKELTDPLFIPWLKHAIAGLLKAFEIQLPLLKIQGCIETVVCELRCEPFIVDRLEKLREKLFDQTTQHFVKDIVDSWKAITKDLFY